MRVMIADDSVLLREGLVRLLTGEGMEVVAAVGTAGELYHALAHDSADLVILDVRMPPTQTDEGVRAAQRIRQEHPGVAVLLLSQHVEASRLGELLRIAPRAWGICSRIVSWTSTTSSTRCAAWRAVAVPSTLRSSLGWWAVRSTPVSCLR